MTCENGSPLIVLDDGAPDCALVFTNPSRVIVCRAAAHADDALHAVDKALAAGQYCAGFMAYELGYALEPRLRPLTPPRLETPLLWFGVFGPPQRLEGLALNRFLRSRTAYGHSLSPPWPALSAADYMKRFGRVKALIGAGDVYQINLTFPLRFSMRGETLSLYRALKARQPVAHGGYLHTEEFDLLSLSPELFVRAAGGRIASRPMKGTAARDADPVRDRQAVDALRRDPKQRAENLMIVDLIRNDLSRVSVPGSVRVPKLFAVDTYPTFHGMSSDVTAKLTSGTGFRDIVRALFPCGSVTGAPKIRAQEVISELEPEPRGAYTGALGHLAPDGRFSFNVAIRTLHIGRNGQGAMGVGSGVVWDSDGAAEYEECLLKGRFLTQEAEPFQLIETLLWRPEHGFHLLAEHLERLSGSARHFDFTYDEARVLDVLGGCAAGLPSRIHRVRLLLHANGSVDVSSEPLTAPQTDQPWRFALSERRVWSGDPYLRHKTTRRTLHDRELARLNRSTGCDEVLFLNERGELTEGSRTTLFLRRDGRLLTPPLDCGVLDGVLRRTLMRNPDAGLRAAVLYPADLTSADEILLGNSVRGLIRAMPAVAVSPALFSTETP